MKLLSVLLLLPLIVVLMAGCGSDSNTPTQPSLKPSISSVTPNSAYRGQRNVTMTILGANLSGVSGVTMGTDITVHGFREISAAQVDVDFSVGASAAAGPRTIAVITTLGTATSASAFSVSNNVAPVPVIKVTPAHGTENTSFEFDGSGSYDTSGTIQKYLWDFHDGTAPVAGIKVMKKFPAGTYKVKLTVTDNEGASNSTMRDFPVEPFSEIVCTDPVRNHGLIYGTVIAVEPDNNAIVQLDQKNAHCSYAFYKCGDMRDAEVDLGFFGIISEVADRGNGVFRVRNSCPFHWPPHLGQRVFLFYKSCEENHC